MKVGLELEVKASGADQIKKIDNDLQNIERRAKAIAASIRAAAGVSPLSGRAKAGADPVRAARDALGIDRDRLRVLRMQFAFEARARAEADKTAKRATREEERRYQLRSAFASRMFRQQAAEQARAERAESATRARQAREQEQAFRRSLRFNSTVARLRAAEERASERDRDRNERARTRAEALRTRLREREDSRAERDQSSARNRFRSRGRDAVEHSRDAYHRLTRPPAYAAAAGAAGTAAIARRALGAEVDVDAAEVDARIYGGLSKDAARQLRDRWAAPLAENLGVGTAKLLSSYTDALKLGIPEAGAKAFSELATKTSEAWGLPFEAVTDTLGTVNSILTSTGETFDFNKIKSVANTLQYLAAKQSTTPQKMVEYLRQGAGGAAVLGMSQEAGLAFGSASTSLGNQAGESGMLIDYTASRLIELPNLVKKKGDEGKHARGLVRDLGYGSASDMDAQRRVDPDKFFFDFFDRLSKIADPRKQEEAMRFFFGREWLGEGGRIVKGNEKLQEARKLQLDAKNTDAIEEVWSLHKQKLSFVLKRIRTGFVNILGEFGKVLSPLATQFGDYFLDWSRKLQGGGLKARINAVITGFIEGLGFRDLPDLLKGFFGVPGATDPGAVSAWKASARAFAEGIRDVFGSVKSVIGAFTGGDPEVIARWTGRILALSAALFVLGPVLTVLGGFVSLIATLASIVSAVGAVKGLAGVAGSAGAAGAAGGIAGAAIWAAIGGVIGTAFLAKVANSLGILKAPDLSKGLGRSVLEFLDPGLAARIYGDEKPAGQLDTDTPTSWQDPPARSDKRTLQERQLDELARIRKLAEDQTKAEKESSDKKDGLSALLHKSSLNDTAANQWTAFSKAQIDRFQDGLTRIPNEARLLNAGSWRGAVTGGPLSGSVGGGALGPGGLSGRGVIGGRDATPGSGPGGGGSGSALSVPNVGPMTEDERNKLGLIMKYEGGYKNQMNYMGKRQGLDPNTAKGYTAQGYYQILNSNWRRLAPRLGITTTNAMSSSLEDQTKVALALMRENPNRPGGGIQNWSNYNPALRGALARGERAPTGSVPTLGSGAASAATNFRDAGGQYDGLRIKGLQAIAGGSAYQGVTDLMRTVQAGIPGGVRHFAAVNDRFHSGTGSKHAAGLAFDTSLIDASKSIEAAEAIRAKIRAAGLSDKDFRVIDEYQSPSARSTGGHLHTQFNTAEAARKYAESIRAQGQAIAGSSVTDGLTSTGWRKVEPGEPITARTPLGTTTPIKPANTQPIGGPKPAPSSGGSSGGGTAPIININGHNGDPETLANSVQRRLQEGMNRRSHDVDHIYT